MKRNVAVILLVNQEGKVLLQKRSMSAKRAPGKWAFFGGGIQAGESGLEAVKREALEELDYPLTDPRLIYEGIINANDTIYVFTERYDPTRTLNQKEGDGFDWFTIAEALELDNIPHDAAILRAIAGKLS